MKLTKESTNIVQDPLRLNLQYFAGEEPSPTDDPEPKDDPKDDPTPKGDDDPKPTDGDPEPKPEDKKSFTQEDIDRIVKERLDREKKKRDDAVQKERDEAERKRLEEQGEYKELADQLQAKLDARDADVLKAKKESLLIKAGYSEEQVEVVAKLLEGETDEDLSASLDTVKDVITPKSSEKTYADPSAGNGKKIEPKPTDLTEKGKSAYQRLKEKGKIRGRK